MTRMHRFAAVSGTLLLFLSASLFAATVTTLYEAEVLTADASEVARADAELRALQAVLVKVTGDRTVDVLEVLALYDRTVSDLVQQSQVRADDGSGSRTLWVRFDDTQVDQLLNQARIPVWGSTRPMTALVIAVEEAGQTRILAAGDRSSVASAIRQAATDRGIPVVLPLMDLTDQRAVRPDRLAGMVASDLDPLRRRYRGEALAFGQILPDGAEASANIRFDVAGDLAQWQQRGPTRELAERLVNDIADALARRFGPGASAAGAQTRGEAPSPQPAVAATSSSVPAASAAPRPTPAVTSATSVARTAPATGGAPASLNVPGLHPSDGLVMQVAGVFGSREYGRLMSYLRSIDIVDNVVVTGIADDTVGLVVRSSTGSGALQDLLGIGFTLVPDPRAGPGSYRLAP